MVQEQFVSSEKTNKEEGIYPDEPELRFPNFKKSWAEHNIKNLFEERSEKNCENLELLSVTLNSGVIKREEIESKDNSSDNKSNYKRVLPNDIVYNSMRMWQGASGVSNFEGIVSPAYTVLIPNEDVYSKFFAYLFKKDSSLYQFRKYSQGLTSDTWNLKYPLISEIKFKIPEIKEQKKISDFFSMVDKKIELLEKKKLAFNQVEKNVRTNILDFNNTKIEFTKFQLGEIANIKKGFTPSTTNEEYWADGTYNWLSIADMNEKYLSETNKKITEKAIKNKQIVKKNTLIMSFKLTIGKLAILQKDMFTNEAIASFDWKIKGISTEYMYFYLKTINIKKYGSQAAKGITLNNETLNSIPVYLPSLKKQNEIVDILLSFNDKIGLIEAQINELKEFKKGLLQKMFV